MNVYNVKKSTVQRKKKKKEKINYFIQAKQPRNKQTIEAAALITVHYLSYIFVL